MLSFVSKLTVGKDYVSLHQSSLSDLVPNEIFPQTQGLALKDPEGSKQRTPRTWVSFPSWLLIEALIVFAAFGTLP